MKALMSAAASAAMQAATKDDIFGFIQRYQPTVINKPTRTKKDRNKAKAARKANVRRKK